VTPWTEAGAPGEPPDAPPQFQARSLAVRAVSSFRLRGSREPEALYPLQAGDPLNETLNLRLAGGPEAPARGRAAVAGLAKTLPEDRRDVAALLVSEVITNAVLHGGAGPGSSIELKLSVTPAGFRVKVTDRGEGFEHHVPSPHPREGGFGLFLVDRLADRWGQCRTEGSTVWFELDRVGQDRIHADAR
jgi:anti-sigma regulatory factor (Ser/Thr protein kinase)